MKGFAVVGAAVIVLAAGAMLASALTRPVDEGAGWSDAGPDGHLQFVERLAVQTPVRVATGSLNSLPSTAGSSDILFLFPTHRPAAPSEADHVQAFVRAGGTVVVATDGGHADSWVSGLGAVFHGRPTLLAPGSTGTCVPVEVQVRTAHALCLPSPSAMPELERTPGTGTGFLHIADSLEDVFLDLDGDGELTLADQGPGAYPLAAAWRFGEGTVWVVADGDLWRNHVVADAPGHLEFAAELARDAETVYVDSAAAPRSGLDHLVVPLYRSLGGLTTNDLVAVSLLLAAVLATVAAAPRTKAWEAHEWSPSEDPETEAQALRLITASQTASDHRRRTP